MATIAVAVLRQSTQAAAAMCLLTKPRPTKPHLQRQIMKVLRR